MFTGTHGIGKSATAEKLAKELGYSYIPSFAGPVAREMGFDTNQPHTPEQVFEYQWEVLKTFVKSFEENPHAVYDRSPNDLMVYISFALMENLSKNFGEAISFTEACYAATKEYCDLLILPQADFNLPMEEKFNRPVSYNREKFSEIISLACGKSEPKRKLIVPVEYQYDDRLQYILREINGTG
jgi:hypothetical protein